MNQIVQYILIVAVLSFPVVFYFGYLASLEKKTKKIIANYSDHSSLIYKDLKVWVKNFDVFKKKNKFDLDPYQTLYSFNDCDLILNERNFVVIGKTKAFGKSRPLTPTIFEFDFRGVEIKPRHVKIEDIYEVGNDLEIVFEDNSYKNKMTLVIKRVDMELKVKIKTGYKSKS